MIRRDTGPPPLWTALAALLMGLFIGVLAQTLVTFAGSAFGSPVANPTPAVVLIESFVGDLSFVGAALYMTLLRGGMSLRDLGFLRISIKTAILVLLIAGLAYFLVSALYASLFHLSGTDKLPGELAAKSSVAAGIGAGAFVCVGAPICEEFFFRGFLFGVLRRIPLRLGRHDLGPWAAALIVGVLFGGAHVDSASSAQYLIPLGFFGFVLCIVRWRTGSLYPCIALHSLNNAVALGVNEFSWGPLPIVALAAGSLAIVLALTLPLSRSRGTG
jgi:membrane protease YdiL (CAAX protease family)